MRRTFLALAVSMVLAAFSGCAGDCCNQGGCHLRPCAGYEGQGVCQNGGLRGCLHCGLLGRGAGGGDGGQGASDAGAVSYPYYTVKGPRDFLQTHPQSIGP
jgi:hypothetical protein